MDVTTDQVQFYVYDSAGNAGVSDSIPVVESYDSPNDGSSKTTTGEVVVGPKETQTSSHKGKTTVAIETGVETAIGDDETSNAVETSSSATGK